MKNLWTKLLEKIMGKTFDQNLYEQNYQEKIWEIRKQIMEEGSWEKNRGTSAAPASTASSRTGSSRRGCRRSPHAPARELAGRLAARRMLHRSELPDVHATPAACSEVGARWSPHGSPHAPRVGTRKLSSPDADRRRRKKESRDSIVLLTHHVNGRKRERESESYSVEKRPCGRKV
jgi:hypothetical protein